MGNYYDRNGNFEPAAYFRGLKSKFTSNLIAGFAIIALFALIDIVIWIFTGNHIFLN